MAKQGGNSTVTQNVDPQTQAYVQQMRNAALGYAGMGGTPAANPMANNPIDLFRNGGARWAAGQPGSTPFTPPPNPALDAAQAQYDQYAGLGQAGIGALTGGANPFMNSYLSAMNPIYDQIRAQSLRSIGDQAQMAGAFGGSRQGVAEGVALGQIGQNQAYANIDAYNQAQQRAMQAAGMGLGAVGAGAFLPQQYAQGQLNLLGSAIGPYGQTQTQPTQSSPFSSLLGLAGVAGGLGWAPFAAKAVSG